MHTKDSLHSFSILISPTSPVWKSSHPSVSGFIDLLTSRQITSFSHSQLIALFLTRGFWLNFPLHSVLHTSLPSQVMLFPSHSPLPHTSLFIPAAPVQLLFYFSTLSPTKLSCAPAVYKIWYLSVSSPHFALWQASFILKVIQLFAWVCCCLLSFFKKRERKAETASHQCSSPSKQLIVEPREIT